MLEHPLPERVKLIRQPVNLVHAGKLLAKHGIGAERLHVEGGKLSGDVDEVLTLPYDGLEEGNFVLDCCDLPETLGFSFAFGKFLRCELVFY